METEGTLSESQVLNPTERKNEFSRRTVNTTSEESARNNFRLLIDGRLVEGAGTLDVINPATGRVLTTAPRADQAQLEQAVAAAKAAFPSWAATPLRVRAGLLARLADALEAEKGAFARLLTRSRASRCRRRCGRSSSPSPRSATTPCSTCRPRCSTRTPPGRWSGCASRSASSRRSPRGTSR
jgi:hypothetical protein